MTGRIALAAGAGLAIAALLAVGVTATHWEPASAATNCSTDTAAIDAEELAALQAINAFRAQNGRPALLVAPTLNTMAAWKSADSSNQPPLNHTDSLGRAPYTRAIDCGYPGGAAENIAWGYPTGTTVVQGWIQSTGHRNNLLGSYAVMGIGRNGNSWVLNLGFTVEAGSYPVSGGGAPPPPQATTAPATATPPPGSAPPAQGWTPPPTGEPGELTQGGQATPPPNGLIPRTVLPGGNVPAWKLPANVPVKRAMLQMVAFE